MTKHKCVNGFYKSNTKHVYREVVSSKIRNYKNLHYITLYYTIIIYLNMFNINKLNTYNNNII